MQMKCFRMASHPNRFNDQPHLPLKTYSNRQFNFGEQVINGQSKFLSRMSPYPSRLLSSCSPSLSAFSCTFQLLFRMPIKVFHKLTSSTLLLTSKLLLLGSVRTSVKLTLSKQLHLLWVQSLFVFSRDLLVVLLVKCMKRNGFKFSLQHLHTLCLTSSQPLRFLPLWLGFVAAVELQSLLVIEDKGLKCDLGGSLMWLVKDDRPAVLQTHFNNFISPPGQNKHLWMTVVAYPKFTCLLLRPIIFSRPVHYNQIKMKVQGNLMRLALLLLLAAMASCETIGASPYPSYSDVAAIANGPDMSALGVGNVGLGGDSNSDASLPYDPKALDDLSRMINQLLASMNNTTLQSSSSSQDNANSGSDSTFTTPATPPQTKPPTSAKTESKADTSKPAATASSSTSSPTASPKPTPTSSSTASNAVSTATNSGGSGKSQGSGSSASSSSSSSSSSVKSQDSSTKGTSNQAATASTSTAALSSNTNTAASSSNQNSKSRPTSSNPTTSPPSQPTTTPPATPTAPSNPKPSTSSQSSSSSKDPLFDFQDYLSTIFSSSSDYSMTANGGSKNNGGDADMNYGYSDNSATNIADDKSDTSTESAYDANISTEDATSMEDRPAQKPASPIDSSKYTSSPATSNSKAPTPPSTSITSTPQASSTAPSTTTSSSSSPKGSSLCTSDEQCRIEYGSFVADGLVLTCSPTLGVCTYS